MSEPDTIHIGPCPACGFGRDRTIEANGALGFVDVCVNCLTPRRIDAASSAGRSLDDLVAEADSLEGVLGVEQSGMRWSGKPCPRCGKKHDIPSGFDDLSLMLGCRVVPPCGGEPILLLPLPDVPDHAR